MMSKDAHDKPIIRYSSVLVPWQQPTPTESGTAVFCSIGPSDSQGQAAFQELLSALRQQCRTACCELLMSGQRKQDGAGDYSLLTKLPADQVSAITVKLIQNYPGFNVAVANVQHQKYESIKTSFLTHSN